MVWLSVVIYIFATVLFGADEIALRLADFVPGVNMVAFVEDHSKVFVTASNLAFALASVIAAGNAFRGILFEDSSFASEDWIKILATGAAVFLSGTVTIGHLVGGLGLSLIMMVVWLLAFRVESRLGAVAIGGSLLALYVLLSVSPFIYLYFSESKGWTIWGDAAIAVPERPWLPASWFLLMMIAVVFVRKATPIRPR